MMICAMILLGLCVLTVVLSGIRQKPAEKTFSHRAETVICLAALALGLGARLIRLAGLPAGLSAEEALVGMQAKALWQTGGFLFDGAFATQMAQWAQESAGPLLAVLTAPFVGLFGMNALTVRLPLAIVSCLAVFAAYGVGNLLAGKRGARWLMIIYALSPYFVLTARLTYAASLAAALLPIVLYFVLKGLKRPPFFYIGMALMGLMAYTQRMYLVIAPLAILVLAFAAALNGLKKRHALGAAILGLVLAFPAMLTVYVNWTGGESLLLFGKILIPRMENFEMGHFFFAGTEPTLFTFQDKIWDTISGTIFQLLFHSNISPELFAPKSMLAFHFLSLPLILCGLVYLVTRLFQGKKVPETQRGPVRLTVTLAALTFVVLCLFGKPGLIAVSIDNCSDAFDFSAFFLFDALLMMAALCYVEEKSFAGALSMTGIYALSFVLLACHLFTSSYTIGANVYFPDFQEAAVRAHQTSEEQGAEVIITSAVYPHKCPEEAAEMMYLYAIDADPEQAAAMRGTNYQVAYIDNDMEPDPEKIYIARQQDVVDWNFDVFDYEEHGRYFLLKPKK